MFMQSLYSGGYVREDTLLKESERSRNVSWSEKVG